jgi:membrane-associated phospholipid phosphatase
MKLVISALMIAAVTPAALCAQDRSVGRDLRNFGRDAGFIITAPAVASGSDLRTAGLIAAGAAGLLVVADEPVHEWLREERWVSRALRPFGESSPLSVAGRTWFFLLPLSASLYAAGHAFDSTDLRDAGMGCATANLTTTLTRTAVAHLIGRFRPGAERGAFQFQLFAFGPWEQRSFPGGHASNIMSCAAFFNHRFDLGVAGPAVYALASGVGLARIADEAHWTSDTFVGMSYGFAVGRNIARRFLDRDARWQAEQSMQPRLSLGWKIVF